MNMLTSADATKLITELQTGWISALRTQNFTWLEKHLAEDFLFTIHPFPALKLSKREFIEMDKKIKNPQITFVSIHAEQVQDIITSRTVADVKEEFNADLGPGMPTTSEIQRMVSGARLVYASGWRRHGDIWQCFDHHCVAVVAAT
jgi:ketosteroid isomerase-like protein